MQCAIVSKRKIKTDDCAVFGRLRAVETGIKDRCLEIAQNLNTDDKHNRQAEGTPHTLCIRIAYLIEDKSWVAEWQ